MMIANQFINRHNGPRQEEVKFMLERLGLKSMEELIEKTVPTSIQLPDGIGSDAGMSEYDYLNHIRNLSRKNKVFKSYIGLGYYNTIVPPVILRNIFENPGWYTSYTPYQAEISQGRLEALLNFQTLVSDLTGMPIANSSLLDEGTAAAEAMLMFYHSRSRSQVKSNANKFLVSNVLFPHTIEVLKSRAKQKDIELVIVDRSEFEFGEDVFGCMVQYPDQKGEIFDFSGIISEAKSKQIPVAVGADILSLALLTPPGEWGADIVFGSTQRLGIPMGFGGPHAAFFATTEEYKRSIPGRIIGLSKDKYGNDALRMALQTREQHIKREKATSNICTAQALLAIMAGMYGAYHGKDGIKNIALGIHGLAVDLASAINTIGFKQLNINFFDTLYIAIPDSTNVHTIKEISRAHGVNFRYFEDDQHIGISLDETASAEDIALISAILAKAAQQETFVFQVQAAETHATTNLPTSMVRKSGFMEHPVFNSYHSETDMMRYMKKLENKDIALNRSMIPLGSCTMKLNAVSELMPISWPEFTDIHPFVPEYQA
ncbi:MAG: glycine dehydrogenase (aminomethyl-transferring), partial [Bacteroidetes bacterium]|nr:glycine dehydrogenase (aminomethyl-transferring) [Bacteroidota bacterium]